jgi:hypothetical protein
VPTLDPRSVPPAVRHGFVDEAFVGDHEDWPLRDELEPAEARAASAAAGIFRRLAPPGPEDYDW